MNNSKDNNKKAKTEKPVAQTMSKRKSKIVKTAALSTVIGILASAVVGLSVALYFSQQTVATHKAYQKQMDAVYFRAYYDLLDGANDLGITLRKIGVSNSAKLQQDMLCRVRLVAELAEDDLSAFEIQGDGVMNARKFINQLGDFSHSLALKLASGEKLSASDKQTLFKLSKVADVYRVALENAGNAVKDGKTFTSGALDVFGGAFDTFSEPSLDYPEMIYDGPFSSALEGREPQGLVGDEISQDRAQAVLQEIFKPQHIRNVAFLGEGNGDIKTFDFTFESDAGSSFAQIARKGGMLVDYVTAPEQTQNASATEAHVTCQRAAIDFASQAGFCDMQVVWSSSEGGECVVNLVPMQDGAILYPDIVKVKIRESDRMPIGLNSSHYAMNHRTRHILPPRVPQSVARGVVSLDNVSQGRLALIPLRESAEVLAYEFECQQDGTYYIYVDAHTGEEVNILYVLDDGAKLL